MHIKLTLFKISYLTKFLTSHLTMIINNGQFDGFNIFHFVKLSKIIVVETINSQGAQNYF